MSIRPTPRQYIIKDLVNLWGTREALVADGKHISDCLGLLNWGAWWKPASITREKGRKIKYIFPEYSRDYVF